MNDDAKKWSCSQCSLLNMNASKTCEVCGAERQKIQINEQVSADGYDRLPEAEHIIPVSEVVSAVLDFGFRPLLPLVGSYRGK